MGETVDVLVVGESFRRSIMKRSRLTTYTLASAGDYGSGRRSGGVSTLICAVLDDRRALNDDEEPK